jgi:hypothetical protein
VKVKFDAKTPEQRFDFAFAELSKEPVATPAPTAVATVTSTARNATPAPAAAELAAPPSAGTPGLSQSSAASTMSRTDAAQLVENLPNSSAELLTLLEQREREVNQAIQDGQYGYVYIPAMLCKDIALAIEDHANELPDQRRAQATVAVRQLVLAAWELDYFGDLGNKEKIVGAHRSFTSAFAGIKAAYGAPR